MRGMARKDMKKALGASLKAEEQAVRSRFDKAETVLSKKKGTPPSQEQPLQNGAGKVIRDSFTIPGDEYELISRIKKRCMKAGVNANKSEVLRAGLAALDAMPESDLARLFQSLVRVKTGRPAAKK
jgi:hypothetical protein